MIQNMFLNIHVNLGDWFKVLSNLYVNDRFVIVPDLGFRKGRCVGDGVLYEDGGRLRLQVTHRT